MSAPVGPEFSAMLHGCRPQTWLRDLAAPFARGLLRTCRPLNNEGAGNAGRPMRPIAACAMVVVERTRVSQVTPESPGIPRAMVYGLYRALPGEPGFLATLYPEQRALTRPQSAARTWPAHTTNHAYKHRLKPPHALTGDPGWRAFVFA